MQKIDIILYDILCWFSFSFLHVLYDANVNISLQPPKQYELKF